MSGAASIDLKKDEAGLLGNSRRPWHSFSTYSSEELAAVQGDFSESGFVRQVTGSGNVCGGRLFAVGNRRAM